jgi:hypothetical protein
MEVNSSIYWDCEQRLHIKVANFDSASQKIDYDLRDHVSMQNDTI